MRQLSSVRTTLTLLGFLLLTACATPSPPPGNVVVQDAAFGQAVILGELIPIGSIVPYAGDILPTTRAALASRGWLVCDGAQVSRESYADLYRVIGNIHGHGDRRSTFTLPDYQGMFLRGVSGATDRDKDAETRQPAAAGGRAGNAVGSVQRDAVGLHKHTDVGQVAQGSMNAVIGTVSPRPGMTEHEIAAVEGENSRETRPKNVYVNYLIFSGIQPVVEPE